MRKIPALVATLVAGQLAAPAAWGHTFPAVRTVVVQVENCEVALLVGWRPATGEGTQALLARASRPDALRDVMTNTALAPISLVVDGKPLVPTTVRAKIGLEPGGERPAVVVLVTYALPAGKRLMIRSTDTKTTQVSWVDQHSNRVVLDEAPGQGKWFPGVASMLLPLASQCGASPPSVSSPSSR